VALVFFIALGCCLFALGVRYAWRELSEVEKIRRNRGGSSL